MTWIMSRITFSIGYDSARELRDLPIKLLDICNDFFGVYWGLLDSDAENIHPVNIVSRSRRLDLINGS